MGEDKKEALNPVLDQHHERPDHMNLHCAKKATIHQVTTILATSKNVLFPGHNHHAYLWY